MLVRVQKARKRNVVARMRPSWQDVVPPEVELRASYAIAARHFRRLQRAYLKAIRDMRAAIDKKMLRAGLRDANLRAVLAAVPNYNPAMYMDQQHPLWQRIASNLEDVYTDIVQQSGDAEIDRQGWVFKRNLVEAGAFNVSNPFTEQYIREQVARDVALISQSTRQAIVDIVHRGFEEGTGINRMANQIENRVGLHPNQVNALYNLEDRLLEDGLSRSQVAARIAIREAEMLTERATAIARTETIAAEAAGLEQSWQQASGAGVLDQDAKKEWIATMGSGRTCEVCLGLDGQKIPLNETFNGSRGAIKRPPAHTRCRCTMGLVFPEDPDYDT